MYRNESHTCSSRPCAHAASHFIKRCPSLPIRFVYLDRFQIDPVDGTRVDRQFPIHERYNLTFGVLELVHDRDTTCRTEGVPACFACESVDGEVVSASELDVLFRGVDPQSGVLLLLSSTRVCMRFDGWERGKAYPGANAAVTLEKSNLLERFALDIICDLSAVAASSVALCGSV